MESRRTEASAGTTTASTPVQSQVELPSPRAAMPTATIQPVAKAEQALSTLAVALEPEPPQVGGAVRGQEIPQVTLPSPGMHSWNADDLDVPAFLRRQMD